MKLTLRKGIFISAIFVTLFILAIVFKPDSVKADTSSSNQIVKVKDFDANSSIAGSETNLIVKSPNNYTVVSHDNKIYTIDNSNKEISRIYSYSSTSCYDVYLNEVKETEDGDLIKIVNTDGSQYGNLKDFNVIADFVYGLTDGTYYYVDSTKLLHIVNNNGQEIVTKQLTGDIYSRDVSKFGDYYVIGGSVRMIIDVNGNDVTPNLNAWTISYISVKQNYIKISASDGQVEFKDFYYDNLLETATSDDYNNDDFPSHGQSHYNGLIYNFGSNIAKAVPVGFNYSGEITINGEVFAAASQYKDSKLISILYDINSNILITSYSYIQFAGSNFLATDSRGVLSLYTVKAAEASPSKTEIIEEAAISSFSETAKVVDLNGNPIALDQVAIKAVEAIQEVAEHAKSILAEKGVVIPTNAHVSIFDIDLTDSNGNVVKLADGSVNFSMPVEKGIDSNLYDVKVYHILPDGSCEEVKAEWVDGKVQVTATSFSPYVVVYSAKQATPSTGDSSNIMMPIIIGAAAVATFGIVINKKRQFD